jgi:hypothetical protein
VERLRAALENLDEAIDMAENAAQRRHKELEKIIDARAEKRVKAATETAERALRQAREREAEAVSREKEALARADKQRDVSGFVATRLDDAIIRLEHMVGE